MLKFLSGGGEELAREIYRESQSPGMPFYYRTPDLLAYMKREADSLSTKSDVFQLGLVIAELFTGTNPQKKAKTLLDPIEMNQVLTIPGLSTNNVAIKSAIDKMLEMDTSKRPLASDIVDTWDGIFKGIVKQTYDLEGKIFH